MPRGILEAGPGRDLRAHLVRKVKPRNVVTCPRSPNEENGQDPRIRTHVLTPALSFLEMGVNG